ncbi:hypothetical protein IAD21_05157 [Abditibacteriota bacterium]|nr:hypothetical protein IAD21_05157 [Abditibacteriota bacterium]
MATQNGLVFNRSLSAATASPILRMSVRFHDPSNEDLVKQLESLPTIALRDIVITPLHRGAQPPKPAEEDAETALAIGVTELKNGTIDMESARRIPLEFWRTNKRGAGIERGDILIASTGATIGKTDVYLSEEPAIANNHVTIVRVNEERFNPSFVLAILRSRIFQFQVWRDYSGSAQPEIYPSDLGAMRFPALDKRQQDTLATHIEAIEARIAAAREGLESPNSVIDSHLSAAFEFSLATYRGRQQVQNFERSLSNLADGFSLRSSVKFHHPDFEIVADFLRAKPHKRIAEFLAIPIRLGAQLTQVAMDDDGEAFYVHPAAAKKQEPIQTADCHRITQEFFQDNRDRNGLRSGDVLINRSGEGTIGKVAIYDLKNQPCIFADFIMRLRFNEQMTPRFAWYYGRSLFFQSQIEREKRGMGNLTNIFPSQVETLFVPDIGRARQEELADAIEAELKALAQRREDIENGRREIEQLLEVTLQKTIAD